MENPVIIGEKREQESKHQEPAGKIPRIYKILFTIQLICLVVIAGLSYSVV